MQLAIKKQERILAAGSFASRVSLLVTNLSAAISLDLLVPGAGGREVGTARENIFFIMYFGYLLHPPPPLRELARPAEWGFVYMFITGQNKNVLLCYNVTIVNLNTITNK